MASLSVRADNQIFQGIRMRRLLALTLALGAAHFSAMADEGAGWGLRPFIGAGYTWGGDTISHWTYTEETSGNFSHEDDISAGAGLDIRAGLSMRLGDLPLTLQASVSHHIDQTHGVSSRESFRRMPAELLLQWHFSDRLRLGIGARHALNAVRKSSGGTCGDNPCFEFRAEMASSTSVILEGEWMMTPNWGLKARYVAGEKYHYKEAPDLIEYNGNHFGLLTNYYFN